MTLKFQTKTAMIKVDHFDPERLEISCKDSALSYFINGRKELIVIHKDSGKVRRAYDRIIREAKDPDAKHCYIGKNLERVEFVYE